MTNAGWIVVPRWDGADGFQHYKKRDPIWIKVYTRLMSDPAFTDLTFAQRGLLVSIWLEYARSAGNIPVNTATLTRKLAGKVTKKSLDALNHAGFIDIVASKPLAPRYQDASPEAEREAEPENKNPVTQTALEDPDADLEQRGNGHGENDFEEINKRLAQEALEDAA